MSSTASAIPAPPSAYRRYWLPDLLVLWALALLSTVPFWVGNLDMRVARLFYHPENPGNPWPLQHLALSQFLFHAAPFITGLLLFGALFVLAFSRFSQALARRRIHALFVLLAVLLGPGLVVNTLLKNDWGRPRPHHVATLGGDMQYVPPGAIGVPGRGWSFPCGHASIGFIYGVFWLIWRRRRPRLAAAALAGSTALGLLLGFGRMTAGAHFLSDVLWAAWLPWLIALLLYYFVLRVPQREQALAVGAVVPLPRHRLAPMLGYTLLAVAILFGLSMATPQDNIVHYAPTAHQLAGMDGLHLDVGRGDVELVLNRHFQGIAMRAHYQGFGLPSNKLAQQCRLRDGVLRYRLKPEGLYSEYNGRLTVTVGSGAPGRIRITAAHGDIRVIGPRDPRLQLVLNAPNGTVER